MFAAYAVIVMKNWANDSFNCRNLLYPFNSIIITENHYNLIHQIQLHLPLARRSGAKISSSIVPVQSLTDVLNLR